MENVEVSIIVPVYNNEKYLRQCLDSITNQTFKDIEIILVDDGSTDNSASICEEYAKEDSRIIVVHSQNKGVSHARNIGINQSKGKYIIFCDSDDRIEDDFVEVHYQIINSQNVDIVCSGIYRNFYKDGNLQKSEIAGVPQNLYIDKGNLDKYLKYILETMEGPFLSSCMKIYKSEVIKKNKLYFDENMIFHEDYDFNVRFLTLADNIYISKEIKYYYTGIINNGGIKKRNKANVIYEISRYHYKLNLLLKSLNNNEELKDYIELRFIDYYKLVFQRLLISLNNISKSERNAILLQLSQDEEFCKFLEFNKNRIRLYRYIKLLIDKRIYSLAMFLIKKRISI
ncbi:glycosyltransferase family 2 protein [Intestinibacter sp.]|uniref:glycosyltransferase family 2 protein n=1 Tax=Intestinibacter sp. TaxID=1965304 RepID=UPI003AB7B572